MLPIALGNIVLTAIAAYFFPTVTECHERRCHSRHKRKPSFSDWLKTLTFYEPWWA